MQQPNTDTCETCSLEGPIPLVLMFHYRSQGAVIKGKVGQVTVSVFLDTGAEINLVNNDILKTLPPEAITWLSDPLPQLKGIGGPNLALTGKVRMVLQLGSHDIGFDAYVTSGANIPGHLLLGYATMKANEIYCVPHEEVVVCKQHIIPLIKPKTQSMHSRPEGMAANRHSPQLPTDQDGALSVSSQENTYYFHELCDAKLTQTVHLQPNALVRAKLQLDLTWFHRHGLNPADPLFQICCLAEPSTVRTRGIKLDCSLHRSTDGSVFVYLASDLPYHHSLRRGTKLVAFTVLKGAIQDSELNDFRVSVVHDHHHSSNTLSSTSDEVPPVSPEPVVSQLTELPQITQIDVEMIGSVKYTKAVPTLLKLLNQYRSAVALKDEPLGQTQLVRHHITLQPGISPIYVPAYRLPHSQRGLIEDCIDDMLAQNVIQPSISPWNSPLLLVPKPDGTWRPCVDYRKLNSVSVPDRFPLPVLGDLLRSLGQNKVFTTLDLISGFWQIPLDEESRPLTAFSTPTGHWEYLVMPFGLQGSPLTFSRLMSNLFRSIVGTEILVYLDDIIIMSPDISTHLIRLEHVLAKLSDANLKIKLSKCKFLQSRIKYLGHIVDERGISVDEQKTESIMNYPVPRTIAELRSFLGLAGFYRSFVQGFSKVAAPLTSLLKKDVPFLWEETQQTAFDMLKSNLVNAPILRFPDYAKPFTVATDASYSGLGAVLLQDYMGKQHPVAYASRTLTNAERNYSVTELEGLAVVWSLKHFRDFIYGYPVTVATDHRPLVGLFTNKTPTGKFARWYLTVQEFKPLFKFVPGKYNVLADALSRNVALATMYPTMDVQKVQQEQRNDPVWSQVISYLQGNVQNFAVKLTVPVRELFLRDGILYRRATLGVPARSVSQLVVPTALVPDILVLIHNTPQVGHPGKDHTLKQARLHYFWPRMAKEIADYIDRCSVCNANKGVTEAPQPILQYPTSTQPWERVSMDVLSGLATTPRNNKNLLVIIDAFTRYCELVPIPDKSAPTIALAFKQRVLDRHNTPKVLITDNGTEFCNALMNELCRLYKIQKCTISTYHPASNGLAERLNRKILNTLRSNVNFDHDNWDDCMMDVQSAINCSYHQSIGDTPHFALYGYDKRFPYELWSEVRRRSYSTDDPIGDNFRQSQLIHQRIAAELQKASDSFTAERNKTAKPVDNIIGKLVMVKIQVRNKTDALLF